MKSIRDQLKALETRHSRPTDSESLPVMARNACDISGHASEDGISAGIRYSVIAWFACLLFFACNFSDFRHSADSVITTEADRLAAKQKGTCLMSDTEFKQLKDAVTSLAAKNESGFRSMKSLLKKVLRRVTPSEDGYEKLLLGYTKPQQDMYKAGFALLDNKEVRRPRAAAVRVFREFAHRRVRGRYTNENSFCAQFARVYEKYSQLPRI